MSILAQKAILRRVRESAPLPADLQTPHFLAQGGFVQTETPRIKTLKNKLFSAFWGVMGSGGLSFYEKRETDDIHAYNANVCVIKAGCRDPRKPPNPPKTTPRPKNGGGR